MAQILQNLPIKHEAPRSTPSTEEKKGETPDGNSYPHEEMKNPGNDTFMSKRLTRATAPAYWLH
jgi:hypothetical protein